MKKNNDMFMVANRLPPKDLAFECFGSMLSKPGIKPVLDYLHDRDKISNLKANEEKDMELLLEDVAEDRVRQSYVRMVREACERNIASLTYAQDILDHLFNGVFDTDVELGELHLIDFGRHLEIGTVHEHEGKLFYVDLQRRTHYLELAKPVCRMELFDVPDKHYPKPHAAYCGDYLEGAGFWSMGSILEQKYSLRPGLNFRVKHDAEDALLVPLMPKLR